MRVTQLGRTQRSITGALSGSGGDIIGSVPAGQVPTANGSNSWAFGSNVGTFWANGSNQLIGPAINLAAGSNITLTIDQGPGGSMPSNTVRIHSTGGGGSVSFGSNSNQVSLANAPGVSTDSSRADHVHQGVHQLTSNGSNARYEDIDLVAGTGIALGVSAQAITITNIGQGGGGGGSSTWTLGINESGTSFANFTVGSGTWSSDGTTINQTDTAATHRRAKHNTSVPLGYGVIVEAEMQFPTASQGGGANIQAGIFISYPTAQGNSGIVVLIDDGTTNQLQVAKDAVSSALDVAQTFNRDTWYKVRAVMNGVNLSAYIDGTLVGNAMIASTTYAATDQFTGLFTFGANVKFRNFKVWTRSADAPA